MFHICKPLNGEKDIATFISNIMGNFMGVVQYDNEGSPITIQTVLIIFFFFPWPKFLGMQYYEQYECGSTYCLCCSE